MIINEIFAKNVQRPIEGVISADNSANLAVEVDEYVLTNEVAKEVELLLEAYTNYTNANGVWISGFFGSGKSHLLKMLAHLLGDVEGQSFPRQRVAESFTEKATDSFLPALIKKSEKIPAKSLLFNIDQKARLIAKDQSDALLKVFAKVFDESCGYYGNVGHVASFERDLDERKQFDAFKQAYLRISGRDWKLGREESILEEQNVAKAYAEVAGTDNAALENILTKYRNEYSLSIEDFANEVKAWLDKQEPGYRLNFFVDEVGQFIGSNTHLMLNLQTIAESLNTKCGGQAWVFVTSQEDMDKVLGDRTKQQGNDFSKIQARFKTRMKLTSADVEEVIRKRLLEKNLKGAAELEAIYSQESANFKTIFDFADGGKVYRNYTSEDHFIGTYPFVGYQFPLFQAAIEGLSDRNVFEGKNSSVGERSMLFVVQQVAKGIGSSKVGTLATFDQMFEGIRSSLKTAAQKSILTAERELEDELAVRILKALLLVKYVEGFQATARNITVLMYESFGLDLPALSAQVKEALDLLEIQTYVQRNGNAYEYLTDEEQIIEQEIKSVDIDGSEISSRLLKILSSDVVKNNKIRYGKNNQDFQFGIKLDDLPNGQQKELTVHFITPAYPHTPSEIRMHSAGKDELRVVLAPDDRILSDLRSVIKTEKYTRQKHSTSLTPSQELILRSKAALNTEKEKEIVGRVRRSVGQAELVINATDVAVSSEDAISRVEAGFQDLIGRTYTQLALLGGVVYSESQVAAAADPDSTLFDADSLSKLAVPAKEILSSITLRTDLGEQVTMKTVVDVFQAKPYGWDLASIEVLTAHLAGQSKISLKVDGNILKRSEVASLLRNTQKFAHTVITPAKAFDDRKVGDFRKFCIDFFDDASAPKDALELGRFGGERLKGKLEQLRTVLTNSPYPFIQQLEQPIGLLESAAGKPDEWYLSDFSGGDELLNAKENTIDPILGFLNGGQKSVYDEAGTFIRDNANNLSYLPVEADTAVQELLADPNAFRGNRMATLKQELDKLRAVIESQLKDERTAALSLVSSKAASLESNSYWEGSTTEARQEAASAVDAVLESIRLSEQLAQIREIPAGFESVTYPSLIDKLANSQKEQGSAGGDVAPKQTVSVKSILVPGSSGLIENEDEVDGYLAALKKALMEAIAAGKRISL
jgi:hypothetical protein